MPESYPWNDIDSLNTVSERVSRLSTSLNAIFNECFPLIKVKMSSRNPPYMSPLVKYLCKIRNRYKHKQNEEENVRIQRKINNLIGENQIKAVSDESKHHQKGTQNWWDTVNRMTGRKTGNVLVSNIFSLEEVNRYFQEINTDPNYSTPELMEIPEETKIPMVDEYSVWTLLIRQKRTASGPDELPYWLWRDYAHHLAPVITKIFNLSSQNQEVPLQWKLANVSPIPKEEPLKTMNQLRPISITNVIMRIFERLVYENELVLPINTHITPDQHAYRQGSCTTTALLKCQNHWLKWIDKKAYCVKVNSFDFSKAFDSVSHRIICEKLKSIGVNPYVINWVISFLSSRKQTVLADGISTEFLNINSGVPQGSVLGPVLFSVMVNDIKPLNSDRNLLEKFADDLTLSVPQ